MNRRVAFLSLALIALAGFFGWLLRDQVRGEKAHQHGVLTRAAQPRKILPPPPIDAPPPVTPAQYLEVASRLLFSKDRNPTEIVEVKPPPPKPPLPPFPFYFGQVRLSDPVIFLSTAGNAAQKTYRAGDKVGDKQKFVIVSFDEDKITLAFNDEKIEKSLADLRPKEESREQASTPRAAAPPAASRSESLGSSPAAKAPDELVGAPYGAGYYACVAGDSSPDGTIKDGKRKVISHTLMGQACHWETIK
ncbi:MAG TPA: hypothetical protein VMB85_11795 [Bryobacteraceae bacterium]|nr:hypothetical protein [Bryobacteraceae bacterium]